MSPMGIAVLFDRAGRKLTNKMSEEISQVKLKEPHHKAIIEEMHELWNFWDFAELQQRDGCLQFDSFYNGFMAPYFDCYRCSTMDSWLRTLAVIVAWTLSKP